MPDFSLTLVLRLTTSKIINDVAKVQIKSEKITPFGGIIQVREQFSRFVGPVIDKVLGLRCTSYSYQYSEIAGSLASASIASPKSTGKNSILPSPISERGSEPSPCHIRLIKQAKVIYITFASILYLWSLPQFFWL